MGKKGAVLLLYIILVVFGLFSSISFGQNCTKCYKTGDCSKNIRKDFLVFGKSRGALMEIGQSSKFEVVMEGGRDYIVTCCTDKGYYPVHFTITSKESEKVIYDNMTDDYLNSIGFSLENIQTIIIEVTLLADGKDPKDFDENRACVGVNIQFRDTPTLGF